MAPFNIWNGSKLIFGELPEPGKGPVSDKVPSGGGGDKVPVYIDGTRRSWYAVVNQKLSSVIDWSNKGNPVTKFEKEVFEPSGKPQSPGIFVGRFFMISQPSVFAQFSIQRHIPDSLAVQRINKDYRENTFIFFEVYIIYDHVVILGQSERRHR